MKALMIGGTGPTGPHIIGGFSFAQWVGLIAEAMDWELEILSAPDRFASPAQLGFDPFCV